jgi:prepilin-type N-terminal cleavage/methylation domain-containing protein
MQDRAGFTLIEVLVAASMIGIVTLVAATNFRAQIPTFRARGAAMAIAGDINQARLSAVKEGVQYLYVPDAGTTYRVERSDGLGGTEVLKTVDIAAEFPGVSFATSAAKDPYGNDGPAPVPGVSMIFHSNGTVQNAAGVFVQADTGEGTAEHAVTVTAAGRVRVWRYDGESWS